MASLTNYLPTFLLPSIRYPFLLFSRNWNYFQFAVARLATICSRRPETSVLREVNVPDFSNFFVLWTKITRSCFPRPSETEFQDNYYTSQPYLSLYICLFLSHIGLTQVLPSIICRKDPLRYCELTLLPKSVGPFYEPIPLLYELLQRGFDPITILQYSAFFDFWST